MLCQILFGFILTSETLNSSYESLVADDKVMMDLAGFLKEDFSEENLDFYNNLKSQKLIRLDNVEQYVKPKMDSESGKRWKIELSEIEVANIEKVAKKQMLRQGYEPSSVSLSPVAWLQCSYKQVLFWLNDHIRPILRRLI